IAVFVYLLATLLLHKRVGIVAIFVYGVDPLAVYLSGHFQTEQLFTLLILASLYCFVKMRKQTQGRIGFAFLFGLSMGVAALTRAIAGPIFAGLCLGILFGYEQGFRGARFSARVLIVALASMTFLVSLSPWLIRNHKLTGRYILTTEAWQTLAMANNDRG